MAKKKTKQVKIELIRSGIGRKPNQRATLKALGLRKMHQSVVKDANPSILGMVNTVSHLVKVEEIS